MTWVNLEDIVKNPDILKNIEYSQSKPGWIETVGRSLATMFSMLRRLGIVIMRRPSKTLERPSKPEASPFPTPDDDYAPDRERADL